MRRNIKITCLTLIIVLLIPIFASSFAIAAPGISSLEIVKSEPQNGATGVQGDNVAVTIEFSGNVTDESVWESNQECFEFIGAEDEEINARAFPSQENPNIVLVTAQKMDGKNIVSLLPNSDYALKVSSAMTSVDGGSLGQDMEINFTTVDTAGSTKIYILLMVLMVAAMIGGTILSNKRKARAKAEIEGKIKPANPYKMAKEKGISVDEAMEIIAKEKERRDKRLKKAGIDVEKVEKEIKENLNTKRVKGPRPISAGGSTYKTGNKAKAEKKAKEEAERKAKAEAAKKAKGTTNPKSKSKKKKKKK